MNNTGVFELQKLDCNCNDCKFMVRDFEKLKTHKESYIGTGLIDRLSFGKCNKFNKDVSFIPGVLQLETQNCFKHRREQ
tara:strand:+ start:678 stop:914 length:237 start_codon:yes stop_codon:yes gene_type:complete